MAYALAGVAVALVPRPNPASGRIVSAVLALMWMWTDVVYHGVYFAAINPLGPLFAVLFVAQGAAVTYWGVISDRLRFDWRPTVWHGAGAALVAYATMLYPAIGYWSGETYPAVPTFGLTPCPVTIFTFGMLLMTIGRVPRAVLVVPALWAAIGGSAALLLAAPQDWPLPLSALAAIPSIRRR